jgi:hypothetical protein
MNISAAYESALLAVRAERSSIISINVPESNVSDECMHRILAEYCGQFGRIEGISPPTARGDLNTEFHNDVEVAMAYLNYRFQLLQELHENESKGSAGTGLDNARFQAASLLAAVVATAKSQRPQFEYVKDYHAELPLLNIGKMLDLYNGTVDTSVLPLGIMDPVIMSSLKRSGLSRNMFFQFFVGVVLKEEATKLYEAMPVLIALMQEKARKNEEYAATMAAKASRGGDSSDRDSTSAPPERGSSLFDVSQLRLTLLQNVGIGLDGDRDSMPSAVDDSVFSSSMYHQPDLDTLISFSQHHPMLFMGEAKPSRLGNMPAPTAESKEKEKEKEKQARHAKPMDDRGSLGNSPVLTIFDKNMIYFDNLHRLQWLASQFEDRASREDTARDDEWHSHHKLVALRNMVNSLSFEVGHGILIVIVCCICLYLRELVSASILVVLCGLETALRVIAKGIRRYLQFVH